MIFNGANYLGDYDANDVLFKNSSNLSDTSVNRDDTEILIGEGDRGCDMGTENHDIISILAETQMTTGNISNFQRAEACGLNGDDYIIGNEFDNNLFGGNHNHLNSGSYPSSTDHDTLMATAGDNGMYGGGGNDLLIGSLFGDDIQKGGEGNDIIYKLSGKSKQYGNDGNDLLTASARENIMEGGDGRDIFLVGQSPIFHFSYQEINDFGNGGQDVIYFPEKMEDLMLTHEANYEENTIEVFSELTNRLVLKINVLCNEVGLTEHGFWAQIAENNDDFYGLSNLGNLDLKGYVNANIDGFMA